MWGIATRLQILYVTICMTGCYEEDERAVGTGIISITPPGIETALKDRNHSLWFCLF